MITSNALADVNLNEQNYYAIKSNRPLKIFFKKLKLCGFVNLLNLFTTNDTYFALIFNYPEECGKINSSLLLFLALFHCANF